MAEANTDHHAFARRRPLFILWKKVEIRPKDDPANVYLRRWIIFGCKWFSLYLHHILRSDFDRHLHDHPWNFISLLLAGRYEEVTPAGRRLFGVGNLNVKHAEDAHRLELAPGRSVWSLVFIGRRRRKWGFHDESRGGWVRWEDYLGVPRTGEYE